MDVGEVMDRDPQLLEVVHALCAPGFFTRGRQCWQQHPCENRDNRDNNEQLDEREPTDLFLE